LEPLGSKSAPFQYQFIRLFGDKINKIRYPAWKNLDFEPFAERNTSSLAPQRGQWPI
jgi:hypothetical protein